MFEDDDRLPSIDEIEEEVLSMCAESQRQHEMMLAFYRDHPDKRPAGFQEGYWAEQGAADADPSWRAKVADYRRRHPELEYQLDE